MNRHMRAPVVALLFSVACSALAADSSDRPTGVAAADWVPVSDRLGIVLVHREDPMKVGSSNLTLLLKPAVDGYFMIKGADGWTRLVVIEPTKGPADAG